jgi:uncharacterized lipoprotein YddW (UPF0748 family)
MKRLFFAFLLHMLPVLCLTGANPAVEVRAVWLATNFGLDWRASGSTVDEQKKQLVTMLDNLRRSNFNTVFFQVRGRGDVFYFSDIEPLSPLAGGGFDPLGFVVEECHRRGLECHAWFVTYPVGTRKQVAVQGYKSIVKKRPGLCKYYHGEWYLDPGNPAARSYILSLIDELTGNYDVDGIHLDYIRYPDEALHFPDRDTYARYGQGTPLADWRRNNVSILVSEIYHSVKKQKPWVQVSSSPVGKYRMLEYRKGDWTAYESVYQDACRWMRTGKHDALYPMMYFKGQDFPLFLKDWVQNSGGRMIVPGIGAYQMLPHEKDWSLNDITEQLDCARESGAKGQSFFRAGIIANDTKGINHTLREGYYRYPAKLHPLSWIDSVAPPPPVGFEAAENSRKKLCLKWQAAQKDEYQTYTIYCASTDTADVNNPENILASGVRDTQAELDMTYGEFGLYYSVTASDRFHNESRPCVSVFVVHSGKYKK